MPAGLHYFSLSMFFPGTTGPLLPVEVLYPVRKKYVSQILTALYFIMIINRFFINVQVQGHRPHQWVQFKVTGLVFKSKIPHPVQVFEDCKYNINQNSH